MTHDSEPSPPSDVCLLLRAHAEQRWLNLEIGPVLRQLQQRDSLPEEQLGAAMAYLEVLWIEASQRAGETDAAYAQLEASESTAAHDGGEERPGSLDGDGGTHSLDANRGAHSLDEGGGTLPSKARRYHAAVRTLREVLGRQVAALLATPSNGAFSEHASS